MMQKLTVIGLTVAAITRELHVTPVDVEEAHVTMMLPSVDDILEERAMRAAIAPAAEDERRGAHHPVMVLYLGVEVVTWCLRPLSTAQPGFRVPDLLGAACEKTS
jgi:hypothetical protein